MPRPDYNQVYATLSKEEKEALSELARIISYWTLSHTEYEVDKYNKEHPSDPANGWLPYAMLTLRRDIMGRFSSRIDEPMKQGDFEFMAAELEDFNKKFFKDPKIFRDLSHVGMNVKALDAGFRILKEKFGVNIDMTGLDKIQDAEYMAIKPEPVIFYDVEDMELPTEEKWTREFWTKPDPKVIPYAKEIGYDKLNKLSKNVQLQVMGESASGLLNWSTALYKTRFLYNKMQEHLNKLKYIGITADEFKNPESKKRWQEAVEDLPKFKAFLMHKDNLSQLFEGFYGLHSSQRDFLNLIYTLDNVFDMKIMEGRNIDGNKITGKEAPANEGALDAWKKAHPVSDPKITELKEQTHVLAMLSDDKIKEIGSPNVEAFVGYMKRVENLWLTGDELIDVGKDGKSVESKIEAWTDGFKALQELRELLKNPSNVDGILQAFGKENVLTLKAVLDNLNKHFDLSFSMTKINKAADEVEINKKNPQYMSFAEFRAIVQDGSESEWEKAGKLDSNDCVDLSNCAAELEQLQEKIQDLEVSEEMKELAAKAYGIDRTFFYKRMVSRPTKLEWKRTMGGLKTCLEGLLTAENIPVLDEAGVDLRKLVKGARLANKFLGMTANAGLLDEYIRNKAAAKLREEMEEEIRREVLNSETMSANNEQNVEAPKVEAPKNEEIKKEEDKKEEDKKEEDKKEEDKKEELKNEEIKNEEINKEEVKNEGLNNEEVKKEEPKKEDLKKEEPKKEELKKEEPKKEEVKNEDLKKEEPKKEEPKKEEPKKDVVENKNGENAEFDEKAIVQKFFRLSKDRQKNINKLVVVMSNLESDVQKFMQDHPTHEKTQQYTEIKDKASEVKKDLDDMFDVGAEQKTFEKGIKSLKQVIDLVNDPAKLEDMLLLSPKLSFAKDSLKAASDLLGVKIDDKALDTIEKSKNAFVDTARKEEKQKEIKAYLLHMHKTSTTLISQADIKRNLNSGLTSSDEHEKLTKAYKAFVDFINENPGNKDAKYWKKQQTLLHDLRMAAEDYVVLKRGDRWKENPQWKPTTPVGQKRYKAAEDIIKICRNALNMEEFTVENNNIIKQENKFREAYISQKIDDLNRPGHAERFNSIVKELSNGVEVLDKEYLSVKGEKVDSINRSQKKILSEFNQGQVCEGDRFDEVKDNVAKYVSRIIAKLNAHKSDKLTPDEVLKRADSIKESAPFKSIFSSLKNWGELVEFGMKAVKGKGEAVALAFEKENRKFMDYPKNLRKPENAPETNHFKKKTELSIGSVDPAANNNVSRSSTSSRIL